MGARRQHSNVRHASALYVDTAADCNCGDSRCVEEHEDTNSAGTNDECEVFWRITSQDDFLECHGRACDVRAHTFCMKQVKAPAGEEEAWLCPTCVAENNSLTGSGSDADSAPESPSPDKPHMEDIPYDELMKILKS